MFVLGCVCVLDGDWNDDVHMWSIMAHVVTFPGQMFSQWSGRYRPLQTLIPLMGLFISFS